MFSSPAFFMEIIMKCQYLRTANIMRFSSYQKAKSKKAFNELDGDEIMTSSKKKKIRRQCEARESQERHLNRDIIYPIFIFLFFYADSHDTTQQLFNFLSTYVFLKVVVVLEHTLLSMTRYKIAYLIQ